MRACALTLLFAAVVQGCGSPPQTASVPDPGPAGQLDSTRTVSARLADTLAARRAGYHRIAPPSLMDLNPMAGEHWINEKFNRSQVLDLARPAYLMYYPFIGEDSLTLVGIGYTVAQPAGSDPPAGFAGDRDMWHVHLPCAGVRDLRAILSESVEQCTELGGEPGPWQVTMVHVWADGFPSPDGAFAQFNPALPYLAVGIEPPGTEDFTDQASSRSLRELALALGETFGAVPRMGARIAQNRDSVFADRVRADRDRIRALLPALRAARNDRDRFREVAQDAIAAWRSIRTAYLDFALSPQHQLILSRWFDAAIAGYHRTQLPH